MQTPPNRSDVELLALVREGDGSAFAALHARYARAATRLAEAICGDRGRSEDAVQEAFLAIWRSPGQYRVELGTVRTWALAVVRNRAIDSYRVAALRPALSLAPREEDAAAMAGATSADEEAFAILDGVALRASIDLLPPRQAEAVSLAFFGGLSYSEVGRHLGVPTATVKGRIRLGLLKLEADLAPRSRDRVRGSGAL